MKLNCPYCKEEIEITQSEKAKHGYKKLEDHKVNCLLVKNAVCILNQAINQVVIRSPEDIISDKGENITDIIRRLHTQLGRIPTESETLVEMVRIRALREAILG
jgi:hypothetical protein